jgi:hypothetical protein
MNNEIKKAIVTAIAKTIKGTSFIGVRGYTNQQGEVSNYLIIGGISYEKALEHDFNAIKDKQKEVVAELEKTYSKEVVAKAYANVYESLEKRLSSEEVKEALRAQGDKTIRQSDAQNDAYETLAKGVRLHKETQQIHIFGVVAKKTVLKAIEYKATNSRELTIVQNKIKKLCEFKQDKIRTFIFDKAEIKLQGVTINN